MSLSQNQINELTDLVSGLRADVTRERQRANRAEAENAANVPLNQARRKMIAELYCGLVKAGRTIKEDEAVIQSLVDCLVDMIWTHDDGAGENEARERVQELINAARESVQPKQES